MIAIFKIKKNNFICIIIFYSHVYLRHHVLYYQNLELHVNNDLGLLVQVNKKFSLKTKTKNIQIYVEFTIRKDSIFYIIILEVFYFKYL